MRGSTARSASSISTTPRARCAISPRHVRSPSTRWARTRRELAVHDETLSRARAMRGELELAETAEQHAIALVERWYGAVSARLVRPIATLGALQRQRGDLAGSLASAQRALAIEERVEPDGEHVAELERDVAIVLERLGDLAGTALHANRAIAHLRASLGAERPRPSELFTLVGRADRGLGQLEPSRLALSRAIVLADRADRGRVAPRIELSYTLVALHRGAEAVAALAAIATVAEHDEPRIATEFHFALAKALVASGERAHAKAELRAGEGRLRGARRRVRAAARRGRRARQDARELTPAADRDEEPAVVARDRRVGEAMLGPPDRAAEHGDAQHRGERRHNADAARGGPLELGRQVRSDRDRVVVAGEHVAVVRRVRDLGRGLDGLDQPAQRSRVVELGEDPAAGPHHARHLVQRTRDVGDVREYLERVGDVDRRGRDRQLGRRCLRDSQAALRGAAEHAGRQVDAVGMPRELGDAVEDEAGAAADLEGVLAGRVALDQLDLEIVEHPVIGQVAIALVPPREIVVVGAVIEPGHRAHSIASPGVPDGRLKFAMKGTSCAGGPSDTRWI